MNLIRQNQTTSPALISSAVEFFKSDAGIMCLTNGRVYQYAEIPSNILDIVRTEMLRNQAALDAMRTEGIKTEDAQLKHYISELYGAFDNNPDICTSGKLQAHEFVYSRKRKLKRTIDLKHGVLTEREIEVLTEIGLCKLDKEICEQLGISNATLRNHKDSISRKAGTERKDPLAILAYKLNLVDLK